MLKPLSSGYPLLSVEKHFQNQRNTTSWLYYNLRITGKTREWTTKIFTSNSASTYEKSNWSNLDVEERLISQITKYCCLEISSLMLCW